MLLTTVREMGETRVYATRFASIVTYFTEDAATGGVKLHFEGGFTCAPNDLARNGEAVRDAVISAVALRLKVQPAEVLALSIKALRDAADPELPEHYRYHRRSRGRSGNSRSH